MSYEEQLHKAIEKNNYELCVELVVNKKCEVNKPVNSKYPLCLACENNSYEIAQLLINVKYLENKLYLLFGIEFRTTCPIFFVLKLVETRKNI
jgi:hypothetical protein